MGTQEQLAGRSYAWDSGHKKMTRILLYFIQNSGKALKPSFQEIQFSLKADWSDAHIMKGTCKMPFNFHSSGAELLGQMRTTYSGLVFPVTVYVTVVTTWIQPFSQGTAWLHDSLPVSLKKRRNSRRGNLKTNILKKWTCLTWLPQWFLFMCPLNRMQTEAPKWFWRGADNKKTLKICRPHATVAEER